MDDPNQNIQQDVDRTPTEMITDFILNSPPGEVDEILNDVKKIVNDDQLVDKQIKEVLPEYMKSQLTPVKLANDSEFSVLLSKYNDIGSGRYVDPRSRCSFEYNHITNTVSDIQPWQPDKIAEPWRLAVEKEWTNYTKEHYHEGTGSVFSNTQGDTVSLNACLEGHQFQPKKYWNGRWRSIWTISFGPGLDKPVQLKGLLRLHVHYYEDGNVQLVSSRECDQMVDVKNADQLAKDIIEIVKKFENEYQRAISENYQTMSDTTFKALRRPLPVIRSKIEWNKLKGYKIGSELKQQ